MKFAQLFSRAMGASCLAALLAVNSAIAQPAADFQPTVGQQGKDVVWVPTAESVVKRMLDAAEVTPNDYVIDLGSGDGCTVIAAQRGAKALGIEYNPDMIELARRNAAVAGTSDRVSFVQADLFKTDFSQATVLTLFLLPDINLRLRPKILNMKPGTRVTSNTFSMGKWTADRTISSPPEGKSFCTAHFWIVPAKVEGKWRLEHGELRLKQAFQKVSGTLRSGNVVAPITDGKLKGDEITFAAGGWKFKGRVNVNVIEGTSEAGLSKSAWRATRT